MHPVDRPLLVVRPEMVQGFTEFHMSAVPSQNI